MQQTQVPLGEVEAPLQVMEHSVLHPIHRQAELMDLSSWFWQKPSESISAWLLQLWDGGVVAIILSGSDMGKLGSLTTHPDFQQ